MIYGNIQIMAFLQNTLRDIVISYFDFGDYTFEFWKIFW